MKKLLVMALFAASLVVSNGYGMGADGKAPKTLQTKCSECFKCNFKTACQKLAQSNCCPKLRQGCTNLCISLENGAKRCCRGLKVCCENTKTRCRFACDPRNWFSTRRNTCHTLTCATVVALIAVGIANIEKLPTTWAELEVFAQNGAKMLTRQQQQHAASVAGNAEHHDNDDDDAVGAGQ